MNFQRTANSVLTDCLSPGAHPNKELPELLKRGLDRRRISATVLLVEARGGVPPQQSDVRKLVFERLNTGGQQLNAQELRNCLYAGDFNKLLINLARDPLFTSIWEIPSYDDNVDRHGNIAAPLRDNRLFRRMQDCEIVLRFFAFRKRAKVRGAVRTMLDRCMEDHRSASEDDLNLMREDFKARLELARKLFGARVFRYKDKRGKWQPSQPLYDGVMVSLDKLWERRGRLLDAKMTVQKRVLDLLNDEDAYEVIIGRPNTARAVRNSSGGLPGQQ